MKGQINVVTKIFKFLVEKSQFCDFLTAGWHSQNRFLTFHYLECSTSVPYRHHATIIVIFYFTTPIILTKFNLFIKNAFKSKKCIIFSIWCSIIDVNRFDAEVKQALDLWFFLFQDNSSYVQIWWRTQFQSKLKLYRINIVLWSIS